MGIHNDNGHWVLIKGKRQLCRSKGKGKHLRLMPFIAQVTGLFQMNLQRELPKTYTII